MNKLSEMARQMGLTGGKNLVKQKGRKYMAEIGRIGAKNKWAKRAK